MSLTIQELHDITGKLIAEGKGAGTVGVLIDSFPTPDEDSVVIPAGDASGQHLEDNNDDAPMTSSASHGIGGWFLVIEH